MSRKTNPVRKVDIEQPLHCSVPEQVRLLGESPFFASLSPEEVAQIQRDITQKHYADGETIQHAGDPAQRLSMVAMGTVKLVRPTMDGTDVLLDLLGPGQGFGSLVQLGDTNYREDVTAQTHTCILHINASTFANLMQKYPQVAVSALEFVSSKLADARNTIEELSAYPVDQRLAATLVRLADRVGKQRETDILIGIPLSRQDLADMTGSKVETVSRVMSDFRRQGVIDSGRRWISVIDRDGLNDIAAGMSVAN